MGKSKPKIEVTEYFMSEHFGICHAEPDALLSITIKEKTAWSGSQTSLGAIAINESELFGGLKKEGGLLGTAHYLPGAADQVLPDDLAQKLGRANGLDCPGFRGLASLFFYGSGGRGFYWTANTPYLPGVWVKLQRILKRADGSAQWYAAKARIATGLAAGAATNIELVGQMSAGFTGGAGTGAVNFALTDGLAAAPAANDLVLIVAGSSRYPLATNAYSPAIAGYTEVPVSYSGETALADFTLRLWYKVMGGSPDTSWEAGAVAEATGTSGFQVLVFRGVNPASPFASSIEIIGGSGLSVPIEPADITVGEIVVDPGQIGTNTYGPRQFSYISFALNSGLDATFLPVVMGGSSTTGSTITAGNLTTVFQYDQSSSDRSVKAVGIFGEPVESNILYDMNPAHIIHECLTDTVWGMGTPIAALDDAAFQAAADTLYDESFGLTLLWTRQSSIQDFVQEILDHIQGVIYVDPATGLLVLALIRGDYDAGTLDVIDPDNADLSNFSRKLWGDIVNEIIITWTNPENEQDETITVQDDASIAIQGGIVSDSRNYYGVRSATLAQDLAYRDLRSAGQPLASCQAEVDRSQWDLRPASVIKLTWPEYGLSELVMRVQSVDYGKPGEPMIKLQLVEDVFGLDIGAYDAPPSTSWTDPSAPPAAIASADVEIFTLPYFFSLGTTVAAFVDSPEYPEVIAGVLATDDSADTFLIELWDEITLSGGSTEWQQLSNLNLIGLAALVADLDAEATTLSVTFDTIIVQTVPEVSGFLIIGDDGEAGNEIALITADDGDYDLMRGVLDTVPRAWPSGTSVRFINDDTLFEDSLIRSAGELVDYKLRPRTSQGLLALADAPVESYTLTERPWLPNRPANVLAYGEAWSSQAAPINAISRADPWVTVSWAIRNRLDEDTLVLAWDDASATAETGQTTTIEVRAPDDTLLATHDGLAGTTFDVPDASFGTETLVELRVYSERTDADGDFVSLQYFSHWVQVGAATFDSIYFTFDSTTVTMDQE